MDDARYHEIKDAIIGAMKKRQPRQRRRVRDVYTEVFDSGLQPSTDEFHYVVNILCKEGRLRQDEGYLELP